MYSDGSMRNGRGQRWKVGGFGVWWPKDFGDKNHHGLNQTEADFMQGEIKNNGTLLWGVLNALRGSSTRTELGGLIAGVLSDLLFHAGIDNLAVVRGAQKVLSIWVAAFRRFTETAPGTNRTHTSRNVTCGRLL